MVKKAKGIPESQIKRIEEISLFMKNLRLNENYTQETFGKLADVHPNSIHNLEHQRVDLITLFKCIDAAGLTLAQFFEGMK